MHESVWASHVSDLGRGLARSRGEQGATNGGEQSVSGGHDILPRVVEPAPNARQLPACSLRSTKTHMKHPVPAHAPHQLRTPPSLAKKKLTISLLRLSLPKTLVPHQRSLLISHQSSDRDPLEDVALAELSVDLRVADEAREAGGGDVEEGEERVVPLESV